MGKERDYNWECVSLIDSFFSGNHTPLVRSILVFSWNEFSCWKQYNIIRLNHDFNTLLLFCLGCVLLCRGRKFMIIVSRCNDRELIKSFLYKKKYRILQDVNTCLVLTSSLFTFHAIFCFFFVWLQYSIIVRLYRSINDLNFTRCC